MPNQCITTCSQHGHTVSFLEVTQDVIDLLLYHLLFILPVGLGISEPPGVDPIGCVGSYAALTVAPQIAMGISVTPQMFFHVAH